MKMVINNAEFSHNNIKKRVNTDIKFAGGTNAWSRLLFTWITPWMSKFLDGGISSDDLPRLPENDEVLKWAKRLEGAVEEEERVSKLKGRSLRLYVPLLKIFWFQCFLVLFSKLFYDVLQTLATLALRSFVASLESKEISNNADGTNPQENFRKNYFMGALFIVLTLVKILVEIHYSYWCGRVSLRIQGSLISMIFKRVVHWKASVISCESNSLGGKSARKSTILRHIESRKIQDNEAVASSNVFNLIVVDSLAVEGLLINGIECLVFPLRIVIAYLVLKDSLGSSITIFGIITLIIFLVLSFACQIVASSYKAPFMRARDRRIDRCHEVLSEIRTLQMMGLQDIASERVMKCRRVEMSANKIRTTLSLIGNWIGYQMSGIAQLVLILLAIYTGINNSCINNVPLVISASVGVTTLKVLFSLLGPCRNLSVYSFATIEAIISFNRFQSFIRSRPMDLRHHDSHSVTSRSIRNRDETRQPAIEEYISSDQVEFSPSETDLFLDERSSSVTGTATTVNTLSSKNNTYFVSGITSNQGFLSSETQGQRNVYSTEMGNNEHYDTSSELWNDEIQTIDNKTIVFMKNSSYSWKSSTGFSTNGTRSKDGSENSIEKEGKAIHNIRQKNESDDITNDSTFRLRNLSVSLSLGETIIVVGSPGSGKTSLMNAILDEIVQDGGITYVKPREKRSPIAYASQIPWIPNGSIRNTILFGREFNQVKYDKVLESCRLKQDFDSWQDGDLRIVDEGGCSLSGGQRARICLARALYSLPNLVFEDLDSHREKNYELFMEDRIENDLDIISDTVREESSLLYLLDDIFVSLDPGVSKSIFKKLFGYNGLLRSVGTILSIDHNNLSFLMSSRTLLSDFEPKILVLDEGMPVFQGTYKSYMEEWRCVFHTGASAGLVTVRENDSEYDYDNNFSNKYQGVDSYESNNSSVETSKEERGFDDKSALELQNSIVRRKDVNIRDNGVILDLGIGSPDGMSSIMTSTKSETLRKVMEKEGRVTGVVSGRTYIWYFSKLKWGWTISLFLLCLSKTMFDKGTDYYMGSYTSREPLSDVSESIYQGKKFAFFYLLLSLIQLGVSSMVFIGEAICGIRAANEIHNSIFVNMLHAPLCFFDSNPVGRILSRFSTDLLMIDNIPIMKIATVLVGGMNVIFQCIVVLNAKPSLVLLFPIIGLGIYYSVARYFSRSSRELQRMCLVLYSPLCGVFSEAMSGGPIIRAYRAQYHYLLQGNEIIDLMQRAKYMQLCSKEWSSLRTQLLTFPLTILSSGFVTSLFSSFFSNFELNDSSAGANASNINTVKNTGAGIIGIALYYSESIASNIGMVITSYVNMEKEMISAERLHKYDETLHYEKIHSALPSSPICKIVGDTDDTAREGVQKRIGVEIRDLQVRYRRPNTSPCDDTMDIYFPPAISGMNAITGPNEHIGVIGRTGSGKSTFLNAILGLVPITKGDVLLDGVPINRMSTCDKEKLIGILPQVPLILKGWTVENFLDPYRRFNRDEIWNALNICGLSSMIKSLPCGKMLDAVIVPDNYNKEDIILKRKDKYKGDRFGVWRSRRRKNGSGFRCANLTINGTDISCQKMDIKGNNDGYDSDLCAYSKLSPSLSSPSSTSSSCVNVDNLEDERYLSDSQLRYLSLARLVLYAKDYRLILVDEPPPDVSHKDTVDYVPIHQLLRQYFPHCTVFVVAHHAASLKNCNKVWVLGKGRILLEKSLDSTFSQDDMLQLFKMADSCQVVTTEST